MPNIFTHLLAFLLSCLTCTRAYYRDQADAFWRRRRAMTYVRFDDGDHCEAALILQAERANRYALSSGFEIVGVWSDVGSGTATTSLPGISAVMTAANAGTIDAVIVPRIDHLSVLQADLERLWSSFQESEVELHEIEHGEITSTLDLYVAHMLGPCSVPRRKNMIARCRTLLERAQRAVDPRHATAGTAPDPEARSLPDT